MNQEEFAHFRHEAVHELIELNRSCDEEFRINYWPRWYYELDPGTLTFSEDDIPKVIADIQVVGTTSVSGGTWMWGWANASLPSNSTAKMDSVRAYGEFEGIAQLTETFASDYESLGWEMTAIAARILGARGAYRCRGDNGFLYCVYMAIRFVSNCDHPADESQMIKCEIDDTGFATFLCEHLASNPTQKWSSEEPTTEKQWPDAWCMICDNFFQEQGEWNDRNGNKLKIKMVCHHCYERMRAQRT